MNSISMRCVPTPSAKQGRDDRRYDSSDRLPQVSKVLARTLEEIRHVFDARQLGKETFEELWERVCSNLRQGNVGSATAYRYQKLCAMERDRIASSSTESEADLFAKRWALLADCPGDDHYRMCAAQLPVDVKRTPKKRGDAFQTTVNDILEIAIAYWVEASNAEKDGARDRTLFCLMEMSYYLGMANSPVTAAEGKKIDGGKQGDEVRSQVAVAALVTAKLLKVSSRIRFEDDIFNQLSDKMMTDPTYKPLLAEFDRHNTKKREVKDRFCDRFSEILKTWAADASAYPALHAEVNRLRRSLPPTKPQRK